MSQTNIRNWLNRGDLEKLENVVLEGKGARLLGEVSPDLRTRVFLKGLPNYLTKIAEIHDAVVRGSLLEVKRLVESEPKKKLIYAKDPAGTPLIHKSVYYDHQNILDWIVMHFPGTVDQRDREGRIALHYCAACADPEAVWDQLIDYGCDASVCDRRANPAAYYLQHTSEIELPDPDPRMTTNRRTTRNRDINRWPGTLDIKPSNIRIWIHNRDIGKLQYVLWEGHGSKLRCETSNNPRVRKFLEAVPYIMVTIKDIHAAVIKNDIDGFRHRVEEPVSPIILCSKDSNGLNVLHKAAGLGYLEMAKEILDRYPGIVSSEDNEGRTPLHYAAICRDGGLMYDLLVEYGADESKLDNKQKSAAHYKVKPSDVDMSILVMIPEAPRVSGSTYPKNWDWRIIDSELPHRMKHNGSNNNSNNNNNDDSAFGSAESTKLLQASPETETAEEESNGNDEANITDGPGKPEEDKTQKTPGIDEESASKEQVSKKEENEDEKTEVEKIETMNEDKSPKVQTKKEAEVKVDESNDEEVKLDVGKEKTEVKENEDELEKLEAELEESKLDNEQEKINVEEEKTEVKENSDELEKLKAESKESKLDNKPEESEQIKNNLEDELIKFERKDSEIEVNTIRDKQKDLETTAEELEVEDSKLPDEHEDHANQEEDIKDEEQILTITVEETESKTNIEIETKEVSNSNDIECTEKSVKNQEEAEKTPELPETADDEIAINQEKNKDEVNKGIDEETKVDQQKESDDPNTADSGIANTPNDEEQVRATVNDCIVQEPVSRN